MHGRCQVVKLKLSKSLQSKLLSLIFDILKNPEKNVSLFPDKPFGKENLTGPDLPSVQQAKGEEADPRPVFSIR